MQSCVWAGSRLLLMLIVAKIGHITVSIEGFTIKTRSQLGICRLMSRTAKACVPHNALSQRVCGAYLITMPDLNAKALHLGQHTQIGYNHRTRA